MMMMAMVMMMVDGAVIFLLACVVACLCLALFSAVVNLSVRLVAMIEIVGAMM